MQPKTDVLTTEPRRQRFLQHFDLKK